MAGGDPRELDFLTFSSSKKYVLFLYSSDLDLVLQLLHVYDNLRNIQNWLRSKLLSQMMCTGHFPRNVLVKMDV
ncbi:hypothetical protein SOVF_118020 [Spinacia oleracea]|nr:hypothetical protein SOVF_118020 [Spinacia oleracea]